jgi:hypothetical protein
MSVNTLHKRKLPSKSLVKKKFILVTVYHVSSFGTGNILMWIYIKCGILHIEGGLRFTICGCYSWETALYLCSNIKFGTM